MEGQDRVWQGDGYGERTVNGVHVLANCHVDTSGVVAWHANVWKNGTAQPVEYWIENDVFRAFLGAHYLPPNGGPHQFRIGEVVTVDEEERDAVLEALKLLNIARLSPDRVF